MKITVRVKQAGSRRPILEDRVIEINGLGPHPTLGELLDAVVSHEVAEFNRRRESNDPTAVLSATVIERGAESGKVGFGSIYNDNRADETLAREAARLAFEDGLFSVFIGESEIGRLDEKVALDERTVITFIRLTFLAGSYW